MLKKRIFILLKIIAYFFIDNLATFYVFIMKHQIKSTNKILIVGSHQIGDFILSLDSLKEYKYAFPDSKIVLLCNEILKELAEKTNYFDEIIAINVNNFFLGNSLLRIDFSLKNVFYRFKKLLDLKKENYEKIINPSNLFYTSLLVKRLNANEKIGVLDFNKYLGNTFNKPYSRLIKLDLKHELNDFAKFFREISDRKDFLSGLPKFEFQIPKYESLKNNDNYCCVSLSGSFYEKNWEVENFVKSLESINFKIDIVLVGAKNEIEFANKFLNLYKGKNNILNFVGKTSLLEYISIVKHSKFVFGNDSSIVHIAVATKVPSICITSGHGFKYCTPYIVEKKLSDREKNILPIAIYDYENMDCFGCGLICKKKLTKNKKFQCVENIKLEKVVCALNNINLAINNTN